MQGRVRRPYVTRSVASPSGAESGGGRGCFGATTRTVSRFGLVLDHPRRVQGLHAEEYRAA